MPRPKRKLSLFFPSITGVRCNGKNHMIALLPDGRLSLPAHPGTRRQLEAAQILSTFGGEAPRCLQVLEAWNCLFANKEPKLSPKGANLYMMMPLDLRQKFDLLKGLSKATKEHNGRRFGRVGHRNWKGRRPPVPAALEEDRKRVALNRLLPNIKEELSKHGFNYVQIATEAAVSYSNFYITTEWVATVYVKKQICLADRYMTLKVQAASHHAQVLKVYDLKTRSTKQLLRINNDTILEVKP